MSEAIVVGIFSVLIGLVVCLRGYAALRVIISLLGAWVGFFTGAAVVAGVTGDGLLSTAFTWVGGIVGAIVLGLLAYTFYQVAVLLGMGSLGFSVAAGIMAAIGIGNPVVIWIVGGVVALLAIALALATDLPAGILIVLTAFAGANITMVGVLLLLQRVALTDLESWQAPDGGMPVWSSIVALVLAIVGIVAQSRGAARDRRMRAAWSGKA